MLLISFPQDQRPGVGPWLTAGSPGLDDGIDLAEEANQRDREGRRTDERQDVRLGPSGPAGATPRATGRAMSWARPVRPAWRIATKFHFDI
jgi:hypothetical protein